MTKYISNLSSISYIFPVYNEYERLPNLFENLGRISSKKKIKREIIFVDDGSKDKSKSLISSFIKKNKNKNISYKLFSYNKNKGKGFAIKKGVLKSKYVWILTLDCDLSVNLNQIDIWLKKKFISKKQNYAYFGSRSLPNSEVDALWIRKLLGFFFRILEKLIISSGLEDTQCGYKLYNKIYAKKIFKKMSIDGFVHDIALIYLLKKHSIKIKELPVKWIHKAGSKINIIIEPFKMIFVLLKIKKIFAN